MNRLLRLPSLAGGLIAVAILAHSASAPSQLCAQSPLFPNNKPVPFNPYGDGPYGKYGQGAPGLPLKPLPPQYARPLPGPTVYPGYRMGPYGYSYGSNAGYGSSPYIRVYGGAGSDRQFAPPVYILR